MNIGNAFTRVKLSPFFTQQYLISTLDAHSDDCYCPVDLDTWLEAVDCPSSYHQINVDLAPHETIQLDGLRKKMKTKFKQHHFCHYVVKENKVRHNDKLYLSKFRLHKTISKIFNLRKNTVEKGIGIDWSSA